MADNKIQPGEIYAAAVATLPPEAHPAAVALVSRLENKALLSVFRDQEGTPWYELPFCFAPYWENPSKYH